MDYLRDMPLFVEVVRTRSFRKAADALGMPDSTLSRRIAQLEEAIGVRLLNRTTRRVEPTEAGQLYFERCRRIVEEARIAHEALGDLATRPRGTLRVSLPADFAVVYLAPILREFANVYPEIGFDLDLTPRNVDLVAEPYDLAIRMAKPEVGTLVSRVIGRLTGRLYASPGYLAVAPSLGHPADLERHDCLTMPNLRDWLLYTGAQSYEAKVGGRFVANSVTLLKRFAAQDMGIVFLPPRAVAEEVTDGRLIEVLRGWRGAPQPIHAVTATKLLPARTQRFIAFLKERLDSEEGSNS